MSDAYPLAIWPHVFSNLILLYCNLSDFNETFQSGSNVYSTSRNSKETMIPEKAEGSQTNNAALKMNSRQKAMNKHKLEATSNEYC